MVLVISVALCACGRKDRPLPPLVRIAEATRDLRAVQEGRRAVLTWSYPAMTTAGGSLPDVEAVEVWRATIPVGQEPTGTSPQQMAIRSQLLEARGEMLESLDTAAIESATRGSSLVFRDDLQGWYEGHRDLEVEQAIWYSVRTVCCRGRVSHFSNIVRLMPQVPPEPPGGLALEPTSVGIRLTWESGDGVDIEVERSADGLAWQTIASRPATDLEWTDDSATQERRWWYRLRSVKVAAGGGRVVSEPSEPRVVEHRDVYPPATPSDLVCLPEGTRVLLRWSKPFDAENFRVSRRLGDEAWVDLAANLRGTTFEDERPPVGTLLYAVRAADKAGNESPAATCTTVVGDAP